MEEWNGVSPWQLKFDPRNPDVRNLLNKEIKLFNLSVHLR